jgi:hypothetical protein
MISAKQHAANRQNGQKSTGPRTPEGKALMARNAVTHGLLAQQALLPHEDGAALATLTESMTRQLQPVGALEALLVDVVIASAWRLRRLLAVEDYLFQYRYPSDRERRHPGECFVADSRDDFTKLTRYEAGIERTMYRALHELERLQEARRPEPGAPEPLWEVARRTWERLGGPSGGEPAPDGSVSPNVG